MEKLVFLDRCSECNQCLMFKLSCSGSVHFSVEHCSKSLFDICTRVLPMYLIGERECSHQKLLLRNSWNTTWVWKSNLSEPSSSHWQELKSLAIYTNCWMIWNCSITCNQLYMQRFPDTSGDADISMKCRISIQSAGSVIPAIASEIDREIWFSLMTLPLDLMKILLFLISMFHAR